MPVHHRLRFLTFPMRTSRLCSLWPDMRPLRFRRVPFGRDVAFDPGGATASRIAMPHMLPSTVPSVSASAKLLLSWLNPPPHPIRSLCTLRIRRRRRLRNTRFPAVRYRLTGAGLSPAGSRQLRLTHRNRKFESISLQRRVCELSVPLLSRPEGDGRHRLPDCPYLHRHRQLRSAWSDARSDNLWRCREQPGISWAARSTSASNRSFLMR